MKKIDYRRKLERNKKKKRIAKVGILSAFGIIGMTSAIPTFASEWTANSPESIQIEQGATSYAMKLGDTLWIISTKMNVNINSLASINNIDLSNGQQYSLSVGTVIHFSESEIKAVNSTGQAINEGVKVNDSNKIVAEKPIGTDVSKDVADGKASNKDVIGKPDNTGKLPKPNNDGNTEPSNPITPEIPVEPELPVIPPVVDPETPVDPEKPTEPSTPTNKDVYDTVNVDVNGSVLASTSGYTFIFESTASTIKTLENGNTITTYTTTKVWQLNVPTEVVPVNPTEVGNSGILASTLEEAGAQGEAKHNDAESQFYWAWFAVNEGSDDKVWAFKTAPVKMTDGSIWYTIVFYVDYI